MIPQGTKVYAPGLSYKGKVVKDDGRFCVVDQPAGFGRRVHLRFRSDEVRVAHTLRNYLSGLYEEA